MEKYREQGDSSRPSGVKSIYILYISFFAFWCAGLLLGEVWPGEDQPLLLGLPAWFWVGCIFSFIGVSVALILCVRRYFR